MVGQGCTGVGIWVGTGEGYTGYPGPPSQDPIFNIFSLKMPSYGQMKAILRYLLRFLNKGLEWVPEWPQNGSQNDLRIDLPDLPRLVPRWPSDRPSPDLRYPMVQNRHFLRFY